MRTFIKYSNKKVSELAAKLCVLESSIIKEALSSGMNPALNISKLVNPLRARLFIAQEQTLELEEDIEKLRVTLNA